MPGMSSVELHEVSQPDVDIMFSMMSDPESRRSAPYVSVDTTNKEVFAKQIAEMIADPTIMLYSAYAAGHFVGVFMTYQHNDHRELFYWLRRIAWGRGLATAACIKLLQLDRTRPMHARVLSSNPRALAVLDRIGFEEISREPANHPDTGEEVERICLVKN